MDAVISADNQAAHTPVRPERFLKRIADKQQNGRATGSIVIVAFGDSVTMGATSAKRLEPSAVYHHRFKQMLESRFPAAIFSVINSGIGGDNAADGLKRVERDVLQYKPDLVIIGFGLNDVSDDPAALITFTDNIRRIVREIRAGSSADMVLLTPSFMASRDSENVDPAFAHVLGRFIQLQTEGHVGKIAAAIREVGEQEGVAVADVYARWQTLAESGTDTTAMLANGLNHPTGEAHQIAADALAEAILP